MSSTLPPLHDTAIPASVSKDLLASKEGSSSSAWVKRAFKSLFTVSSRLQQTAIVTAFFYGFDHILIRVVLHVMAFVWLVLLPEMNPAVAMGFFGGTKELSGEDRARFWVNFAFLVVSSVMFLKASDLVLRGVKKLCTPKP
ncbi:hypothetical protein DYB37_013679 [Aphanomyces astaci]|uniref:Uncharacterized protein n=1 Tax=Aphanomyces astaci TaxID=112090 RepID=A0A3R7AS79_APHAT|nr:hypothetical protein DYB35_013639 [Aphanomyces astaci]RHZ34800.1 hypothetical protein DYB37_013679 [Aphanomyces astaci]